MEQCGATAGGGYKWVESGDDTQIASGQGYRMRGAARMYCGFCNYNGGCSMQQGKREGGGEREEGGQQDNDACYGV
jgi:hypothetical protein